MCLCLYPVTKVQSYGVGVLEYDQSRVLHTVEQIYARSTNVLRSTTVRGTCTRSTCTCTPYVGKQKKVGNFR